MQSFFVGMALKGGILVHRLRTSNAQLVYIGALNHVMHSLLGSEVNCSEMCN